MEAGTASIEITPLIKTPLFGYPCETRSYEPGKDEVIDPLHARALYIQNSSGIGLLLISLDLCILLTPDARAFRQSISAELGLPVESVWITCTHTHSAPFARLVTSGKSGSSINRFVHDPGDVSIEYGKWVLGQLKKIGTMAVARKAPVTLSYRETMSGLGYNRRCKTPEGIRNCWNINEFPDRTPSPMKNLKHVVVKLDYLSKSGGIVFHSIGIHPVVLGKESKQISGDWPHYARKHIENRMEGYQAIFTMEAGAQVHPWLATQAETRPLRLCGEAIGAEAVLLAETAQPLQIPDKQIQPTTTHIPGTKIEISMLELGSLLIVALPFELSSTWARKMESELARPVIFLCLCNGWDGYWMSPEEFDEGGYEIEVARSRNVTAENCIALLAHLKAVAC